MLDINTHYGLTRPLMYHIEHTKRNRNPSLFKWHAQLEQIKRLNHPAKTNTAPISDLALNDIGSVATPENPRRTQFPETVSWRGTHDKPQAQMTSGRSDDCGVAGHTSSDDLQMTTYLTWIRHLGLRRVLDKTSSHTVGSAVPAPLRNLLSILVCIYRRLLCLVTSLDGSYDLELNKR